MHRSRSWWSRTAGTRLPTPPTRGSDDRASELTVIGVTGTDGKSTVVALAAEMLWACRWHPGQIGTVQIGIFDEIVPER